MIAKNYRSCLLGMAAAIALIVTVPAGATPPIWEPNFGTPLNLSDDTVGSVSFGTMSFPFIFTTYTGATPLFVSSNGFVSLGGDNGNDCCSGEPAALVGDPFPRIAPLWLDLNPGAAGDVYVNTFSDDVDPAVDRIVVTWDTVLFDNGETARAQLQMRENGQIVFGYDGLGPLTDFNDNTLIGLSRGGNVPDPGSRDLTNTPFTTGSQTTVYEHFVGSPPAIDVDQKNIVFTPFGRIGWMVTSHVVPEPSSSLLAAITFAGPLCRFRRRKD